MNEAWQILGLDPSTATEKDIKSAYARLLKQHRPDQDPEGFRRLRWAYEKVMASLTRAPSGDAAKAESGADATVLKGSALETALSSHDLPAVAAALGKLREIHRMPLTNEEWPVVLGPHLAWLASVVDDELLMDWMIEGHTWLAELVFKQWEDEEQTDRMLEFVETVAQKRELLDGQESLTFAYELAFWVAFWSRSTAAEIGNAVFAKLPPVGREALLETLEERMDLGRWFEEATPTTRRFLWVHLRRANRPWDWDSEISQWAIAEISEGIDRYCAPLEIWREQISPQAWQKLEEAIEKVRDRGSQAGFAMSRSYWFQNRSRASLAAFLIIAVALALRWILPVLGGLLSNLLHPSNP